MSDPIITIHEASGIGRYAVRRPVVAGELRVRFAHVETAREAEHYTVTVRVPDLELVSAAYWQDQKEYITIRLKLLETIKGTSNRKAREEAALVAMGAEAGKPITRQAWLDWINKEIEFRVTAFNRTFIESLHRIAGNAASLWGDDAFPDDDAKIAGLRDAVKAVKGLLAAARDEKHRKGREKLLAYLREQKLPEGLVDWSELENIGRHRDGIFGDD
jgi:hypothetical protein